MIQTKTNRGWHDYCDVGVETHIRDANGDALYTGDVVAVISHKWGADLAQVADVAMVVFDQHKNFGGTDEFYVSGWASMDWSDGKYVIQRVDLDLLPAKSHFRIVELNA